MCPFPSRHGAYAEGLRKGTCVMRGVFVEIFLAFGPIASDITFLYCNNKPLHIPGRTAMDRSGRHGPS